jgi:1-acyl-sn-glycerol-3-phosphate acyltransferase
MSVSENSNQKELKLIDIDKVVRSQQNRMVRNMPQFLVNLVKKIIKQKEINGVIVKYQDVYGVDFLRSSLAEYNIKPVYHGLENLPDSGRFIFVSNHPLGGADYGAIVMELEKKYPKLKVLANDILTNLENLKELFLPVGVFGKTSLQAQRGIEQVLSSNDIQLLTFPAGRVSRKKEGKVEDLPWNRSIVRFAKKHKRDLIPVYVDAVNSRTFYFVSGLRKLLRLRKLNIEIFLIPGEFFKKEDQEIPVYFGKPIPYSRFENDTMSEQDWAQVVKREVYELKQQLHAEG